MILLQCRRHPEGWHQGIRPDVPPKPERFRNRVTIQEECEYVELVKDHVYGEPKEVDQQVQTVEDSVYVPMGSKETLV